ncbi:MAG: DUF4340 domain-containing protein [Gemmatimonadota bacterium]|nr:DUF4340 domain-containing protein [Gemmatimonadota bacterium]
MNSRQLKIIAIVLAVAVLLYLPRVFRNEEGSGSVGAGDGFRFRLSDPIVRVDIIVQEEGDTIRLERDPAGWKVDGYAADEAKVDDLLGVLPDLASDQLVARNPANHPQMGLAGERGRRIEVYTEAGGPLAFLLGDRDLTAGGYYVRSPDAEAVFRLESPAGGYLGRDRDGWRPRTIASVDTAGVREILLRREGDEVVLRRDDAGWRVDGAAVDSVTAAGLLRVLSSLSATGFPTPEEESAADFSEPDASLDVFAEGEGDVTDRTLVLSLRLIEDAERGDWLVRRADGTEVYRLAEYTVRSLLPEDLLP